MKLLMMCELELPADFFVGAKVAAKLEPQWLKLMDEVQATANEFALRVINVRCEPVRPRQDSRGAAKANGGATRRTRRGNVAVLPHGQLPVDETV